MQTPQDSTASLHKMLSHISDEIDALSPLVQARGEAVYRAGEVLRCEIFPAADSVRVDAKVSGTTRIPGSVVLRFDTEGNLVDRMCTCPAFSKAGYRGKEKNLTVCKHCAAVLYKMRDDYASCRIVGLARKEKTGDEIDALFAELGEPMEDTVKTDLPAARMLEKYERDSTIGDLIEISEKDVRLIPSLTFDRADRFLLEFSIGNKRPYVVRDVQAMGRAYLQGNMIEYGKGLVVFFDELCFEQRSAKLLRYISEMTETDREYAARQSVAPQNTGGSRMVYIPVSRLGEFCEMYSGEEITYTGLREGVHQIRIHNEMPPIHFTAEACGDGVTLSHNLADFRYSFDPTVPALACVTYEGTGTAADLYWFSGKNTEAIHSLLEAFRKNTVSPKLHFSSDAQVKLRRFVLPKLKAMGRLTSDLPDGRTLRSHVRLVNKVYIDRALRGSTEMLTAKLIFSYGEDEFTAYAREVSQRAARIPRDLVGEYKALYILKEKGFGLDPRDNLILTGEDRIFEFLSDGMEKLRDYAEVYITDAVRNIGVRTPQRPTVGVKLEHELLQVSLTGDLPADKIGEILEAYRQKKKYYRLEDGSFLKICKESIGFYSDLESALDLGYDKLQGKEITLLPYRGLYLENLLNSYPEIEVNRSRSYKTLVNKKAGQEYTSPQNAILREYQKSGVRWLKALADYSLGGILADEMGLGKTLQVISLLSEPEAREPDVISIVVAPNSLVYNWKAELEKYAPFLQVTVVSGTQNQRYGALKEISEGVVITSYDSLKRDLDSYLETHFRYCIIDEAQYIKNQNTQAALSVKSLDAEVRFALTGTPVENSLGDLWSIFDFILPGYLYNYTKFRRKYELPIVHEDDTAMADSLRAQIRPFILRRTKKEVLTELPEKIESVVYAEMEQEQRDIYMANLALARKEVREELESVGFDAGRFRILALLTRLRRLCCDPSLVLEDYSGLSAKKELCLELVKESVEEGHKILIFSQFVSMLDILKPALEEENISCYVLTGDTPSEERVRLVNAFNQDDTQVFLISLRAGGTGLNLTAADVVIHFDPWWNQAVENQATDRAHRIGQENVVRVFKLLVKDTVEDQINEMQRLKQEVAGSVIGENETFISSMSREDILSLFRYDEEEAER